MTVFMSGLQREFKKRCIVKLDPAVSSVEQIYFSVSVAARWNKEYCCFSVLNFGPV